MIQLLVLAVPLSLTWMVLTGQFTLVGFLIGYIPSLVILRLSQINRFKIVTRRFPVQLFWFGVYVVRLGWDILLSSIDVAQRVLNPRMPINPGIVPISTQDPSRNVIISALSAHGITITPGELVVDFDEDQDVVMYVHCLDVDEMEPTLVPAQSERLTLIKRMLGRD